MTFAARNGQSPILMAAIAEATRSLSELQARMASASVLELYRYLNDEALAREYHRIYLTLLRIGKDATYTGADALALWYERNLKMVANLLRIAEPDDRILVIVGSGHLHLMQQLAAETRAFAIEPAAHYLAP